MLNFTVGNLLLATLVVGLFVFFIAGSRRRKNPPVPNPVERVRIEKRGNSRFSRNYLIRHWRGHLPLEVAFWMNGALLAVLNILLWLIVGGILGGLGESRPILACLLALGAWVLFTAIAIWQIVGIWRSALYHVGRGGKSIFSLLAMLAVILFGSRLVWNFVEAELPIYKQYVQMIAGNMEMESPQLLVSQSGTELSLDGAITEGVTEEVRRLLDANPSVLVIHLDSAGGWSREAQRLAELIRARGLETYVSAKCFSACVDAFMGGGKRSITQIARFGFHQPYTPGASAEEIQQATGSEIQYFTDLGVDRGFLEKAFSTPSELMWFPTADEMMTAGVANNLVDAPQSNSRDPAAPSDDDVNAELMKMPVYAAIREADPDTFNSIRHEIIGGLASGKTFPEAMIGARVHVTRMVRKFSRYASNESLIEMAKLTTEEIGILNSTNPDICYAFVNMGTNPIGIDPKKYFSPELRQREFNVIEMLVRSAHADPRPVPTQQEVLQQLQQVFARLRSKHGDKMDALNTPTTKRSDYQAYCAINADFLAEIVNLGPDQGGKLMRYLAAQQ